MNNLYVNKTNNVFSYLFDYKRSRLLCLVICFCISFFMGHHYGKQLKKKVTVSLIYGLLPARNQVDRYGKNILFLEPEGIGRLTAKQACAVESAVRSNPDYSVHVLFRSHISDDTGIKILEHFPNLKFSRIKETQMIKGTPYGPIYKFHHIAHNNTDVLKFLTLFNFGGVYVDMDILLIRPLSELALDWVVRISKNMFSGAILSLSAEPYGRDVVGIIARQLALKLREVENDEEYPNDLLASDVITDTLKKYCSTSYAPDMYSVESCPGLHIYENKDFPLTAKDMLVMLTPGSPDRHKYTPFVLNMKPQAKIENLITQNFPEYAEIYCPTSYQQFGFEAFTNT